MSRRLWAERVVDGARVVLCPLDQCEVERVEYDGAAGEVSVTFRPSGIRALDGVEPGQEEAA